MSEHVFLIQSDERTYIKMGKYVLLRYRPFLRSLTNAGWGVKPDPWLTRGSAENVHLNNLLDEAQRLVTGRVCDIGDDVMKGRGVCVVVETASKGWGLVELTFRILAVIS